MTAPFARAMKQVTAMTRSGDLTGATALIKSLLLADSAPPPASDPTVIEGSFTRLDHTAQPAKTARDRTSLREVLLSLRKVTPPTRGTTPPVPAGATFAWHSFANASGKRDYKLYLPATALAAPMPLIIMLHGCTQNPDDFARGTRMNALAEQQGFIVAYPAQPPSANANGCWNWFRPEDQARGRGEPDIIAGIARDIMQTHSVDPARVCISGLSAGGATAAIVAAAYPDIFCAVGVHSGLPIGAARGVAQAFAAMRSGAKGKRLTAGVPSIIFHGTADNTVNPLNGDAVGAQLRHGHGALTTHARDGQVSGGRSYRQMTFCNSKGTVVGEDWTIAGAGHAWAGGDRSGSYTDPAGPDASEEMLRFFKLHRKT